MHIAGANLAILAEAGAIVFAGGIGENTLEVRTPLCDGLRKLGLHLEPEKNVATLAGDAAIYCEGPLLAALVIRVDDGMRMA